MANTDSNPATRKLPFNYEAEQAVLSAVMLSPDAPLTILNELKTDDFYAREHRIIFDAMCNLFSKKNNSVIDHITLTDELESKDQLDNIGGAMYIAKLIGGNPSPTNYMYYMNIVKHHSVLRQLIQVGSKIVEESYSAEDDAEALSNAEAMIYNISKKSTSSNLEHIRDSLTDVLTDFDESFQNPGAKKGLMTGLSGLDMLTNGFQNSDVIQLAARPGVGKTSLAMNMVINIALKGKKPCAVFSLEMPKIQLARRMACSVGKVSMKKVMRGELDEKEQRRFRQAVNLLAEAPIFIDDSSINTPAQILSKCRRLKNDPSRGLAFITIDYLGLMRSGLKITDRQQEVSEISRSLKILAKELDVPVLVLSQLNRAVESRKDHRPVLSDLRESGSVEQDADIVMFIYKSENYRDIEEKERQEGIAELIVEKHRNGEKGTIKLRWDGETTTFSDLPSDSNLASLAETAPPLPQKYQDAYENAKTEPLPEVSVDNAIFDGPIDDTPPPFDMAPLEQIDDDYDPIFDDSEMEELKDTLDKL